MLEQNHYKSPVRKFVNFLKKAEITGKKNTSSTKKKIKNQKIKFAP